MAHVRVVDLPPLIPVSTSTNVGVATNGVGNLEDASSITIWVSSSANAASSNAGALLTLQVCQFNPAMATSATRDVGVGNSVSTGYVNYVFASTTGGVPVLTTGSAITISNVSFRGIRLINITSATANEPIAWVTKQISV